MSGGYAAPIEQLLEMLRLDERMVRRGQTAWQLGLPEDCWESIPYIVRQTASAGGLAAAQDLGHKAVQSESRPLPPSPPEVAAPYRGADGVTDMRHCTDWQRQYAVVGATMPALGGKNVKDDLRARFPNAVWLQGASLHQAHNTVQFDWKLVDDSTWLASLQRAVLGGSLEARRPDEEGRGRTLVFAEDVAAAKEVTKCLQRLRSPPWPAIHRRWWWRRTQLQGGWTSPTWLT